MIEIIDNDVWTTNYEAFLQVGLPFREIGSGEYVLDCSTLSVTDLDKLNQLSPILEGKLLCKKEDDTLFGIIFWNHNMFLAPTKVVIDEDNMELFTWNTLVDMDSTL